MMLESIRVREYKNIRDSGEVVIRDGVTCLVGKNESGKTSLLEALYRLNPLPTGHPEAFEALRDYPRRHFGRDRERVPGTQPITATFALEDEDVRAVETVYGPGVLASRRIRVSRDYENVLHWDVACRAQGADDAASGLAAEPALAGAGEDAGDTLESARANALRRAREPARSQRAPGPDAGAEGAADIGRILGPRLPGFLYFDEYSVMSGRLSIPRLRGDGQCTLTPGERTARALLRLAEVDLSDFGAEDYDARKASLEAAASAITDEVLRYWSQNRQLAVELDIDREGRDLAEEPCIDIRIRNERHRITLNFGRRSQGFAWFFSFVATLSELRRSERTVLLLDEPGLGLHAAAQADLLRFIDERLAASHQVVYSTHSPFMVAAAALDGVRTVEDCEGAGSQVSHAFFDHGEDTRLPLQAALGRELARALPLGAGTLLVDAPSDHVFLTALGAELERRGRVGLDPRWTVVPVGGLRGVCAFAALLSAGASVAIVADLEDPGGDRLADSPQARSMLERAGVVRLAELTATPAAGFEDLFAESFYVDLVNRSHAAAVEDFEIRGEGPVVRRIESATGVRFNRYLPARFLLEHAEALCERLDEATLERFEALFRRVNERMGARSG